VVHQNHEIEKNRQVLRVTVVNYRFFGMRKRWSDLSLSEFTMNAAAPGGAPPRRINYRDFQMKG